MRPKNSTLVLAALAALALAALDSGWLIKEVTARLEPAACRLAAAAGGLCSAASAGISGGGDVHKPGAVCAAVPVGRLVAGLDGDGYVAAVDSAARFEGVPLLTGFAPGSCEEGASASSPQVVLGITVVRAFEETPGLPASVLSVGLADLENPEVTLACGTVVRLGRGAYALKLERLRDVLLHASYLGMEPDLVDLRFRDQVVVRPGAIPRAKNRGV